MLTKFISIVNTKGSRIRYFEQTMLNEMEITKKGQINICLYMCVYIFHIMKNYVCYLAEVT